MRKFTKFLVVLALIFIVAVPAQAEMRNMWAKVYSWDGTLNNRGEAELTALTTGITYKVLRADSDTSETLYEYGDQLYTAMTNPVSTTNFASTTVSQCGGGQICFQTDPTDSGDENVDLIVTNATGCYTAFVENFNRYKHSIVIDQRPGVPHTCTIWYTTAGATTGEIDTGIDFVTDTFVSDVRVEVVTTSAGSSLSVGLKASETSGDADGFRKTVAISTAGFVADTGVITNGTTLDYTPASTYGALLVTAITGTDSVINGGGRSYLGHVITGSNATSLTYTSNSVGAAGRGYIYTTHTRLR